jgi:4-hydroxybenzoate polyprenyltransferase
MDSSQEPPVQRRHHRMLPVWFFVGLLLLAYGVIVLIASLSPEGRHSTVVLAQYHAGIWAGVVLLLLGGFYTLRYWPRRRR